LHKKFFGYGCWCSLGRLANVFRGSLEGRVGLSN